MTAKITWTNETRKLSELKPWARNPRQIDKASAERLADSFASFGQVETIAIGPDNELYNGHQRLNVLRDKHGADFEVEVRVSSRALTEKEREKLTVYLHKGATGEFDLDTLANEFELDDLLEWGFEPFELGLGDFDYGDDESAGEEARSTLAERFGVPPFSVLDARQGYWQSRKDAWIALGIKSELGRGGGGATPPHPPAVTQNADGSLNYTGTSGQSHRFDRQIQGNASEQSGTSIFDPVLCELAYRWWCPAGGHVLDPFAGGSVRGVVASLLGYQYTGIDLSARQIEANNKQADELTPNNKPHWIVGDSALVDEIAAGEYDFVFSCPPYGDLEVYSDDPGDLSNMDYESFISAYRGIIAKCVAMLKPNRFACFVVGDIRDKKGFYRNFPAHTIEAFQDAGMTLYNEAILVTAIGSLPIRVGRQFGGYRKLGKTHQNVLVFYKGDPKAIKTFGDVEFGSIEAVTGGTPELMDS